MRKRSQSEARREQFRSVTLLPADWDAALPAGHFLRQASLHAHESSLPDVQPLYLCYRNAQAHIIFQAAFQLLPLRKDYLNRDAVKPWQHALWKAAVVVLRPRLLVAGQLYRHDIATLHAADSLSPFDAFLYYRRAIREAAQTCNIQAVLVKDAPEAFAPFFQHYEPKYLLLRNDISMSMALPEAWQSLADYEKSLKHKYAQRLRKARQHWQTLDVRELDADAVTAQANDIHELYLQVSARQTVRLGSIGKDYLPALRALHPERLKVWGIYEAGVMIAFASGWVEAHSFDMFYIGFDYGRNAALQLYFNILFFAVEQGIALRKERLILGRTALEAKARAGCTAQYLHTFVHIRNPLLRRVAERLQQGIISSEGDWEQRHPFK